MRFSNVLLAALGVASVSGAVLQISQPSFKDPHSGQNQALLDIDIEAKCVSDLTVVVHLPDTYLGTEGTTGTFAGASFAARPVNGFSNHGGATTVTIAWDLSTHEMTFTNFVAGGASGPASGLPGYVNLNFNIPESAFVGDVLVVGDEQVPLTVVATSGAPVLCSVNNIPGCIARHLINLSTKEHFTASNIENGGICGDSGTHSDPIFQGFQGQQFQFHGLPDEHFNLVSSPNLQLNSHFVYLSSGKCDYNDTECFTHPGTYMDVLGFSIADSHVKLVAGTHDAGLRLWLNDVELHRGAHVTTVSNNATGTLKYHHNGHVEIATDIMNFEIVNSDMFMNMRAALNSDELLRVGSTKHTVTDSKICKTNSETHHHQLIEQTVAKKYPVSTPLHGLIGQTWRNVKVCAHDWMGTVQDYLVSDLFATDNHYSYFKW